MFLTIVYVFVYGFIYSLKVVPVPFSVAAEVKQVFLELSANTDFSPCELKPVPRRTELDEVCFVNFRGLTLKLFSKKCIQYKLKVSFKTRN